MSGIVIAVDGPSGVGKSTVCREVARRLGLSYLDTGATYRVAALSCMNEGVDFGDADAVVAVIETMNVEMMLDPDEPRVTLDGEDVSRILRSETVTGMVSEVAINLDARAVLGEFQRDIIAHEVTGGRSGGVGIIAEGRDITTVVAPDADVRVLLTADPEVRVARRALEIDASDILDVREAVLGRDAKDAKAVEFHEAADGVVTIDTTELSIDQVVSAIVDLAHRAVL
ncbi:MAG: (d)CMP kinase [Demequinaceae bacterium]|nr:(d)CMP kinase [Demequinaceae bacterium]